MQRYESFLFSKYPHIQLKNRKKDISYVRKLGCNNILCQYPAQPTCCMLTFSLHSDRDSVVIKTTVQM